MTSDKARAFGCKILYFTLSSEHQLNKFAWFTNYLQISRLGSSRILICKQKSKSDSRVKARLNYRQQEQQERPKI